MIKYAILNKMTKPVRIVAIQTGPRALHILLSPMPIPSDIDGKVLGQYDLSTDKAVVIMVLKGSSISIEARGYIPSIDILRTAGMDCQNKEAIIHVLLDGPRPETV